MAGENAEKSFFAKLTPMVVYPGLGPGQTTAPREKFRNRNDDEGPSKIQA
jgi:hypothetical protein